MSHLPVIVGFGGYNAAGRSSFHHAYRRTVLESLNAEKQRRTGAPRKRDANYTDVGGGVQHLFWVENGFLLPFPRKTNWFFYSSLKFKHIYIFLSILFIF